MIDTSAIGDLIAPTMEQLTERFEDVEGAYVRTVALVIEVDSGDALHFLVSSTEDRPYAQIALLEEGVYSLEDRLRALAEDGD